MLEHLVVDSGAIIKGCGYEFHKTSKRFWTVQDVVNEIRDSKSLHLLETLPFELEIRSAKASKAVSISCQHLKSFTAKCCIKGSNETVSACNLVLS
jgi:rRNA maturation endonuclease Nob1